MKGILIMLVCPECGREFVHKQALSNHFGLTHKLSLKQYLIDKRDKPLYCDYGCGREAIKRYKNGTWCCCDNYKRCPEIVKRRTRHGKEHGMYGKKHKEESKQKMSSNRKGKNTGENNSMNNPESRLKISLALKGRSAPWAAGDNSFMRKPEAKIWRERAREFFKSDRNPCKKPENRKKQSEFAKVRFKGEKNPMYGSARFGELNPMYGKKQSQLCKDKCREWMLNGGAAYTQKFIKNPSKPQVKLFQICCNLFPYPVLNYPLYNLNYAIDIAIPSLSIAIEYDGLYWHQNKEKDLIRQERIEKEGWKVIRYIERIPTEKELIEDINEALNEMV